MKIIILSLYSFFMFESLNAQIFKARCILSSVTYPDKENSFMPSGCSQLIVYDNTAKRVFIYKEPEEIYDLISYSSTEKDKSDSSIVLFTFQGIDNENVKCKIVLGESKKGLEKLAITYQNKIFCYVMVPLQ